MERIVIEGGHPLKGTITIGGAKNSAVALIPAALLAARPDGHKRGALHSCGPVAHSRLFHRLRPQFHHRYTHDGALHGAGDRRIRGHRGFGAFVAKHLPWVRHHRRRLCRGAHPAAA